MNGEPTDRILGRLLEGMESLQRDMGRMEEKQDQHMVEFRESRQQIASTITDVQAMKPHVEDYKRTKQRALGVVIGGSLGAGGVAGWLSRLFG